MAARKKRGTKNLAKPDSRKIPMVRNVAELGKLKATPRKPLLIHFTKDQWQSAIKGAHRGRSVPKKGFRIIGIPDPNGDVVVMPECAPSGPDEECILRLVPGLGDPRRIDFVCQCRPVQTLEPPEPPPPACTLSLGLTPPRLFCSNNACNGTCQLRVTPGLGRIVVVLSCVCN